MHSFYGINTLVEEAYIKNKYNQNKYINIYIKIHIYVSKKTGGAEALLGTKPLASLITKQRDTIRREMSRRHTSHRGPALESPHNILPLKTRGA